MTKEKFSIRKTNRGAVSARIALVGLLAAVGLATGTEVKADSTNLTSDTMIASQLESDELSVEAEPIDSKEYSQDDELNLSEVGLDQVKELVLDSTETLTSQNNVVGELSSTVNTHQEEVDALVQEISELQHHYDVLSKKGENGIKDELLTTESNLAVETEKLRTFENQEKAQENAVKTQEVKFKQAREEQTEAENHVNSLKTIVSQTEQQLSINSKLFSNEEMMTLETEIANQQKIVEDARRNLKEVIEKLERARTEQGEQLAQEQVLKKQLSEKETESKRLQSEVNRLTNEIERSNANINRLNSSVTGGSRLVLTPAYVENLLKINNYSLPKEVRAAADKALTDMRLELNKLSSFSVDEKDKEIVFDDWNHLPEHIRVDLSLYTADLLNQVRTYFGAKPLKVTSDSVKITDVVARHYLEKKMGYI